MAARGHPAGQDGGLHARGLRTRLHGGVSSRECALVQVADCLIGCMGYAWNGHADPEGFPEGSAFKRGLCAHLAEGLGRPSLRFSTWASEGNFNVSLLGE